MHILALYEVNYKINGVTYAVLVLATSFDWAINHPTWRDMKGVTSARCSLIGDNIVTLLKEHSISVNNILEVNDTVARLIRQEKC